MEAAKEPFPAGLRVLVVDDDPICLLILEKMLRCCLYDVTTCGEAIAALAMLRQNKNRFDLVISDVYMPDMDGFKLLELVGLEMDLPVIMMSIDGETSAVMKGITHGACDYLLKPVRMEALRNIWQHVVRKRRNEAKEMEHFDSAEDIERMKHLVEDKEHTCSSTSKKRKHVKEEEDDDDDDDDDDDHDIDDPTALKKPRVVWSMELHQQFVSAVNQLGIDKAVPKRILELMGIQGLTRENVASHLQKYRLYLKRLSVAPYQNTVSMPFAGGQEVMLPMSSLDGLSSMQSIGACSKLAPQALASVHSGMLRRLGNINGLGTGPVDSAIWQQVAALQGSNYEPIGRLRLQIPWLNPQGHIFPTLPGRVATDHPQSLAVCQSGSSVDDFSGLTPSQHQIAPIGLGAMGITPIGEDHGFNSPGSSALMMQLLQQKQQQQQHSQHRAVAGANLHPQPFLGQNILSTEASQHIVQLPNTCRSTNIHFNDKVRKFDPSPSNINFNGCLGGKVTCASHELSKLVNARSAEDQLFLVAGADFESINGRYADSLSSPSCLSVAAKESGINPVNVNKEYAPQCVRGSMVHVNAIGNPCKNSICASQEKITAWHGQNANAVQGLVQAPHHLENQVYGQIANVNANGNTNIVFGQVQGECLDLESLRNANGENSHIRPLARRACTGRQHSTADSNHTLKEDWILGYEINTLEYSGPNLKDDSSDDLLTLILKQQQQMTGFTGTEVPLDGYTPGICM